MRLPKPSIAAALLSACGLGLTGNAYAEAYAYSYNNIFNLSTVFTCTSGIGCPGNFSFISYQSSSGSDANTIPLPAGGVADSQVANAIVSGGLITGFTGPLPDAPVSFQTPDGIAAPANNNFTAIGRTPVGGNDYARGDAQIVAEQVRGSQTGTQAINVAEGLITDQTGATANGSNTSTTGFSMGFSVSDFWTVAFSFDAMPFIEAFIGLGGAATGDLDVSFTIRDANTDAIIFNWAPNGVADATGTGVATETDDASLNIEIADITANGLSALYDPKNTDADCTTLGGCQYAALSDAFGPGQYTLILTMHEGVVLSQTAIPEPGTLALLGVSLLGLPFARRNTRKNVA